MSDTTTKGNGPKSIRQKRILSLAAENPDASMAQLADEVATATPEVVESVLETYGDPAESPMSGGQAEQTATSDGGSPNPESESVTVDEATGGTTGTQSPVELAKQADPEDVPSSTSGDSVPSPETLTPKQRETLVAIRDHPDATQRELAEILGVSAPTVSNRVNAIPSFEWDQRRLFVDLVLGSESGSESGDERNGAGAESTDASETNALGDETARQTADEPAEERFESPRSVAGQESDGVEHVTVQAQQLDGVIERLDRLSERLDESQRDGGEDSAGAVALDDPELAHKVIQACMEFEDISEAEELAIIRRLV